VEIRPFDFINRRDEREQISDMSLYLRPSIQRVLLVNIHIYRYIKHSSVHMVRGFRPATATTVG